MAPGKGMLVNPYFDIEATDFDKDVKLEFQIVTSEAYNPNSPDGERHRNLLRNTLGHLLTTGSPSGSSHGKVPC